MTEVKIKQSRPVGSGFVIAVVMLTAFVLYKVGPKLAGIEADHAAWEHQQEAAEHNRKVLKDLNEAFRKEGNAADRLVKSLPERTSEVNETSAPSAPKPPRANVATFFGQLAREMEEFSRRNNAAVAAELLQRGLTDDGRGKTNHQADEMTAAGTAFDEKGFQHTYELTFRVQGADPDQKFELLRAEIDGQGSKSADAAP